MKNIVEELGLKVKIDTSGFKAEVQELVDILNKRVKEINAVAKGTGELLDFMPKKKANEIIQEITRVSNEIKKAQQVLYSNKLNNKTAGILESAQSSIASISALVDYYAKAKKLKDKDYKEWLVVYNEYIAKVKKDKAAQRKEERAGFEQTKKHFQELDKLRNARISKDERANKQNMYNLLFAGKTQKEMNDIQDRWDARKKARDEQRRKEEAKAAREARKQENVDSKPTFIQGIGNKFKTLAGFGIAGSLLSPLVAAAGAIREVTKASLEYSKQFVTVQAITGATTKQMMEYEKSIQLVSSAYGYSAKEGLDAILTVSRMGVTVEYVGKVMESAAALSSATGGEFNRSAELLVSTINAFNLGFEQSKYVADQMVKTLNSSALDISKYSTILGYVGAAAETNNVTFEQTNSLLTVLANNGIKASTVGTSLRSIMAKLTEGGKDLSTSLDNLRKKNISYADAVDLVGTRAANALKILLENGEAIKDAGDLIKSGIGSAESQAALKEHLSWVQRISNAWEGVKTAVTQYGAELTLNDKRRITSKTVGNGLMSPSMYSRDRSSIDQSIEWIIQDAVNALSLDERRSLGLTKTNVKDRQASILKFSERFLKSNFNVGDEFSNLNMKTGNTRLYEILDRILKDTLESNTQSAKAELLANAKLDLDKKQRENKVKLGSENSVVLDYIKKNIDEYGLDLSIFTEEDIKGAYSTGVRNVRVMSEDLVNLARLTKQLDELKSLPSNQRTVKVRDEIVDLEKQISDIKNYWMTADEKKTKKTPRVEDNIKKIIKDLSIARDLDEVTNMIEQKSSLYTDKIGNELSETGKAKLVNDYFMEISPELSKLNDNTFDQLVEMKKGGIEYARKLLDDFSTAKRKELLADYGGDTSNQEYNRSIEALDATIEDYRKQIENTFSENLNMLTSARTSSRRSTNDVYSTLKVNTSMRDSDQDDQNAILAKLIFDEISKEAENRSNGKRYTFGKSFAAKQGVKLGMLRDNVESAYDKERANLSATNMNARSDLGMLMSGNYDGDELASLYSVYGGSNLTQLSGRIRDVIDKTSKNMANSTIRRNETIGKIDKAQRQINKFAEDDVSMIKSLANEQGQALLDAGVSAFENAQQRMMDAHTARIEAAIENEERLRDKSISALDASVNRGLTSQSEYASEKKKIEDQYYEETNKLMEEKFNAEKAMEQKMAAIKFSQTLAEIALNVLLAESSKGLVGLIGVGPTIAAFGAIASAQYAAQAAAISKKQYVPQKFEEGGIVTGPSHRNGGVPFTVNGTSGYEMEGGEFIVRKKYVASSINSLNAINSGAYNDSSKFSTSDSLINKIDSLIAISERPIRAFVTSGDLAKNERSRLIINGKTQI